jgi:hypothetical protein
MDRSSPLVTISSKLLASGVAVSCHSMRACVSFESFLRKDALFASARAGSNGRHGDDAQLLAMRLSLDRRDLIFFSCWREPKRPRTTTVSQSYFWKLRALVASHVWVWITRKRRPINKSVLVNGGDGHHHAFTSRLVMQNQRRISIYGDPAGRDNHHHAVMDWSFLHVET